VTRLKALSAAANNGSREALEDLRRLLDEHPEIPGQVGDLAKFAERTWVELIAGADSLQGEAIRHQIAGLKADLLGARPTCMERLLVDHIAVCQLAERHAEMAAAHSADTGLEVARFRLQRAESAQRRYLTSVKTLATLRALVPQGMVPLRPLKLFKGAKQKRRA
jgi:hypothetical protein